MLGLLQEITARSKTVMKQLSVNSEIIRPNGRLTTVQLKFKL